MKPEQFIRDQGLDAVKDCIEEAEAYGGFYVNAKTLELSKHIPSYDAVSITELMRLVDSLDRYNKFESKQEAIDAITNAPEGATDYRKLSCGTRYIKQGPRFFEYWNGSEWCRPTVPFTDETHILRFDKLEDLKQSIKDHESIYGEEQ
ncbi:TPA: hypothetical protein ACSIS1_002351 [Acinetobacter baumannii]|uniref:hypothetical protein n=1 Tax=Acinetobacter baumannii TaxID=470 RepID=UPI000DE62B78|nr:hypothetical protein [Acinetobacter baumannii]SSO58097.1 Uncharacterised protein [Acinetobacter baumannii]HAV5624382.1 hypothetical protein [Acinetobacter baumannii]